MSVVNPLAAGSMAATAFAGAHAVASSSAATAGANASAYEAIQPGIPAAGTSRGAARFFAASGPGPCYANGPGATSNSITGRLREALVDFARVYDPEEGALDPEEETPLLEYETIKSIMANANTEMVDMLADWTYQNTEGSDGQGFRESAAWNRNHQTLILMLDVLPMEHDERFVRRIYADLPKDFDKEMKYMGDHGVPADRSWKHVQRKKIGLLALMYLTDPRWGAFVGMIIRENLASNPTLAQALTELIDSRTR